MIFLFFTIAGLVGFHFLWESILAPSFRMRLRFELFRLRDELRWLQHHQAADGDDELYRFVQGAINNGLRLLPRIDFALLSSVQHAVDTDEGLRRRIERRRSVFDASDNSEVRAIYKRLKELTLLALGVNTAGAMIYIVPIIGVLTSLGAIKRFIKNTVLIPESELAKVAPQALACA